MVYTLKLIAVLNIYNSFNNIKFTKEKKKLPSTRFLEIKIPYKKIKINHSTFHIPKTNYNFKYLQST